jgi:hypothetical protein
MIHIDLFLVKEQLYVSVCLDNELIVALDFCLALFYTIYIFAIQLYDSQHAKFPSYLYHLRQLAEDTSRWAIKAMGC